MVSMDEINEMERKMGVFVIRTNQRNEKVFWVVGNRRRLLYRWQITTGKYFNKDGKEMSAKALREAKGFIAEMSKPKSLFAIKSEGDSQ